MIPHPKLNSFVYVAAMCSLLGAITTALLIFLPGPQAADFDAQLALHQHPTYLFKLWVLFLHPQVNLIACLGVAVLLFNKRPASIMLGIVFLSVWAYTEMSQQALIIDALNQYWRPGYLNADTDSARAIFATLIEGSKGIADSQYFLLIYGFGFGSLLFGVALFSQQGLAKWIGVAQIFIGLLSLLSFIRYYMGVSFMGPALDFGYDWIYPYLQPAVRVAIGVWLIQQVRRVGTQHSADSDAL